MTITTLCYIENDDKYLMLHRVKKQNDINKGKWIGEVDIQKIRNPLKNVFCVK